MELKQVRYDELNMPEFTFNCTLMELKLPSPQQGRAPLVLLIVP